MPTVCIQRPNRSEPRKFRLCDVRRIARYARDGGESGLIICREVLDELGYLEAVCACIEEGAKKGRKGPPLAEFTLKFGGWLRSSFRKVPGKGKILKEAADILGEILDKIFDTAPEPEPDPKPDPPELPPPEDPPPVDLPPIDPCDILRAWCKLPSGCE